MQPIPPFFILVGIADESFIFVDFGHELGLQNYETPKKTADQYNCFIEVDR